jgi:hypothetical protein
MGSKRGATKVISRKEMARVQEERVSVPSRSCVRTGTTLYDTFGTYSVGQLNVKIRKGRQSDVRRDGKARKVRQALRRGTLTTTNTRTVIKSLID